jgi:hypothetical protein
MAKFGFKIKTRAGVVVDDLQIGGNDRADAERKVGQIYQRCTIMECFEVSSATQAAPGEESCDLESAINLIAQEGERATPPKLSRKS